MPLPPGGGLVQRKTLSEVDDIIGEVPSEASSISLHFAGLPQEEIIRIFHNKFKANQSLSATPYARPPV